MNVFPFEARGKTSWRDLLRVGWLLKNPWKRKSPSLLVAVDRFRAQD